MSTPSVVALIPARAGSKRVPGKNIRRLGEHPLIAYSIAAAREAGCFDDVIVSTDCDRTAAIAEHYGARTIMRPVALAGDSSPDIDWIEQVLQHLRDEGNAYECFSIVRPTSPFRVAATIRRAWTRFLAAPGVDSLRAVELCQQHPGKMWLIEGDRMVPLLPDGPREQPWHSSQYQALPPVYAQNASLEIAWSRVVFDGRTIAGEVIVPFFSDGNEGFDINAEHDWRRAEEMLRRGEATLPPVAAPPFRQLRPMRRANVERGS